MKKSEQIAASILTMLVGVLLLVLKGDFIGILMTVAGVSLIVLGVVDILAKMIPPAVVKIVAGVLLIVCGWVLVEAVLYIVAAGLLIFGILAVYAAVKNMPSCKSLFGKIRELALPSIAVVIGILLLFCQSSAVDLIFVLSGILTIAEGGLLLVNAFYEP